MKRNKLFRPDYNNPQQNATIVADWIDKEYAYREGFRQASLALLATAAAEYYEDPNTGETNVVFLDTLVYPICFNARHFIELFLKDSIRAVSTIGSQPSLVGNILTHDLKSLWNDFEEAIMRDSRLLERGKELKAVIMDMAEVDNTGMTFRYAHDHDENVHLPDLEQIGLLQLGNNLREFFKLAEEFSFCVTLLQQEYALQTFTGKLHRDNIEAIARSLPPFEKWPEQLKSVKETICEELGLSSNDFSKALQLIKSHREFSSLIGKELPLEGLPHDIFSRLAQVHSGTATHAVITREEWLRIAAVMEMNTLNSYSEQYDSYLKHISSAEYEGPFDPAHIARNAYARNQRLRGGLIKLGQKTLLAALAQSIPHLAEPIKRPNEHAAKEHSEKIKKNFERLLQSHPAEGRHTGEKPIVS